MFWVLGVGHGLNELFISGEAADVFWRASARDVCQTGIEVTGDWIGDLADLQHMFPAIAEVIDVADGARAGVFENPGQCGFGTCLGQD